MRVTAANTAIRMLGSGQPRDTESSDSENDSRVVFPIILKPTYAFSVWRELNEHRNETQDLP